MQWPRLATLAIVVLQAAPAGVNAAENQISEQQAWENIHHLTRADLSFFFDRVYFKGYWEFKFSPNVRGMLWRMQRGDSDVTGACESGQLMKVPVGSTFRIKRYGTELVFLPRMAGFDVRLKSDTFFQGKQIDEEREAIFFPHGTGFGLAYVED